MRTGSPPRSLRIALAALASGAIAAPLPGGAGERASRDPAPAGDELVQAAPPPFSDGIFPCTQCHDGPGDPTRRTLGHHEEIQEKLEHARTRRWCLDCHDLANRDMLHLSGGDLVPFYRVVRRLRPVPLREVPGLAAPAGPPRAPSAPPRGDAAVTARRSLPVVRDGAPEGATRRELLRGAAAGIAVAALGGCARVEEFLGTHFLELSFAELATRLRRLEDEHSRRFGRAVHVSAAPARDGVVFGYGLDLSRCVGCRRCVHACAQENNASRGKTPIQWIKVLELDKAHGVDLAHANPYYEAEAVPRPGHFYMPVSCQQCRNPPCVKVCPAGATWKEPDGIVVVDYDWCIGCRCCMAACPYGARRFNWTEPELAAADLNPDTHVLGNRPRQKSVVEKCTFCIQRVRDGRYPACVEVCPMGARKFGNLLDPASEIRQVMDRKRVFILKEELATRPQFYYFYG